MHVYVSHVYVSGMLDLKRSRPICKLPDRELLCDKCNTDSPVEELKIFCISLFKREKCLIINLRVKVCGHYEDVNGREILQSQNIFIF